MQAHLIRAAKSICHELGPQPGLRGLECFPPERYCGNLRSHRPEPPIAGALKLFRFREIPFFPFSALWIPLWELDPESGTLPKRKGKKENPGRIRVAPPNIAQKPLFSNILDIVRRFGYVRLIGASARSSPSIKESVIDSVC